MSQFKHPSCCWICGKEVDLQNCKTDECGIAVHGDCYALKVALAAESTRLIMRKPPHRIRRVAESAIRSGNPRSSTLNAKQH